MQLSDTFLKHFEPLAQYVIAHLFTDSGPAEYTKEHNDLESDMNFSYRALLGELLCAFVIF